MSCFSPSAPQLLGRLLPLMAYLFPYGACPPAPGASPGDGPAPGPGPDGDAPTPGGASSSRCVIWNVSVQPIGGENENDTEGGARANEKLLRSRSISSSSV